MSTYTNTTIQRHILHTVGSLSGIHVLKIFFENCLEEREQRLDVVNIASYKINY